MQIYMITNLVNGKKYIGQTMRKLQRRFKSHSTQAGISAIKSAILKYGRDNFKIECLRECNSKEEMDFWEAQWIERLQSYKPDGYNIRLGGGSRGSHSEESKAKIRKAWEGRDHSFSEETRKKMSEGQKERYKNNPELRKKVSEQFKGRPGWLLGKSALNRKTIICLTTGKTYNSIREAAQELGLDLSNISKALRNYRGSKTVKGYSFRYE